MKNTIYAMLAASLAMLATSGIVALATAAPSKPAVESPTIDRAQVEADSFVSYLVDQHYRQVLARGP